MGGDFGKMEAGVWPRREAGQAPSAPSLSLVPEENIWLVIVLREARDLQGESVLAPGIEEEDGCNNKTF